MNTLLKLSPGRLLAYAVLALFIIFSLLPIWVALKMAVSLPTDVFGTASSLLPSHFALGNFARVIGLPSDIAVSNASPIDFLTAMRNSLIYTVLLVCGQLFFSSLAAYAFARIKFPGRDFLFLMMLAATMIPGILLFLPNFILIKELGWLNTFQGMVAPGFLMAPFAVFFMRQFFLSAPRELEEAAKLDGASPFKIFWQIALPIQKGPLATLGILTCIGAWNDFFWPFMVGRAANVRVMAVALNDFLSQSKGTIPDWTGLMAAVVLSIIPIIILLVVFGRQIVESLQSSGMK